MIQDGFRKVAQNGWKVRDQTDLLIVIQYIKYLISQQYQLFQQYQEKTIVNNANHTKFEIQTKIISKLQQHLKDSLKLSLQHPQTLKQLLHQLIQFFHKVPTPQLISLILVLMGSQMKFQAKQNKIQKQANIQQGVIIALPYESQSNLIIALPNQSLKIINHSHNQPANATQNARYYQDDNHLVGQYLSKPFKVLKRVQISSLFFQLTDIIIAKLIDPLTSQQTPLTSYSLDIVICILQLLQHIMPCVYTFYLLALLHKFTAYLLITILDKQQTTQLSKTFNPNLLKKQQYQTTIYIIKNISQRFYYHKQAWNVQNWNWIMEQAMISKFLSCHVSQKQLFAVKQLVERTRRVQYNSYSVINMDEFRKFLESQNIFEKVFRADNHPEVIMKGKQIFQFQVKNFGLTNKLIDLVLDVIQKSPQAVSKSLFLMFQSSIPTILQPTHQHLLQKILCLSRPALFTPQLFSLIESLILLSPIQHLNNSLQYLFSLIDKYYFAMKEQARKRLMDMFFQVVLMGVEHGNGLEEGMDIVVLQKVMNQQYCNIQLKLVMISGFLTSMKQNYTKKIGPKCKQVLTQCIDKLFKAYHIHSQQIPPKLHTQYIKLLTQVLQSYNISQLQSILTQSQLIHLITISPTFNRYLQYYSSSSQLYLIKKLLQNPLISQNDLKNVMENYLFMNQENKIVVLAEVKELFIRTKQIWIKDFLRGFLGRFLLLEPHQLVYNLLQCIKSTQLTNQHLLGEIMLFKQLLSKSDSTSSIKYPTFKHLSSQYQIHLTITNMLDVLNPITIQSHQKSYHTIYDIINKVLSSVNISIKNVKIKIDRQDKYITFNQLGKMLSQVTKEREVCLVVQEASQQGNWVDMQVLLDENNQISSQITQILKEIFLTYAQVREVDSRPQKCLIPAQACTIFQIATKTQRISPIDSRICHLFSTYTRDSRDGTYLLLAQWLCFYHQAILTNPTLVIENLCNLGYGKVFQSCGMGRMEKGQDNFLRKIIYQNSSVYQGLFQLIQNRRNQSSQIVDKLCWETYQLLLELPRYQFLFIMLQNINLQQQHYTDFSIQHLTFLTLILLNTPNPSHPLLPFLTKKYFHIIHNIQLPNELIQSYDTKIKVIFLQQVGKLLTSKCQNQSKNLKQMLEMNVGRVQMIDKLQIGEFQFNQMVEQCNQVGQDRIISTSIEKLVQIDHNLILNYIVLSTHNKTQFHQLITSLFKSNTNFIGKNSSINKICNNFVYIFSNYLEDIKNAYIIENLLLLNNSQLFDHTQFLKTLNQLMIIETDIDFMVKVKDIIFKCIQFQVNTSNSDNSKKKLYLQLLLCYKNLLISLNPHIQLNANCSSLFSSLLTSSFTTQALQQIIYQILSILSSPSTNLSLINQTLSCEIKKSSCELIQLECGLMNFGCTCYLNSVFQQLFHIRTFRQAILLANTKHNQKLQQEEYFVEFRRLFYNMKYTKRSFVEPIAFCKTYVNPFNQPINLKEQCDAEQFFNGLLDKLQRTFTNNQSGSKQNQIQNSVKNQNVVKDQFQGQMASIVTCQNCFESKVNIEFFYALSLQIKDQRTLQQSLDKMIQPEVICDYFCSTCEKKVDSIHKSRKFQKLPNILFLHLQRLVFDLQSFSKIKLDHPVKFPQRINLQQYFHQQQQMASNYILTGFIVHYGNSQGGHYISLVKNKQKSTWSQYNDSKITKWFWQKGIHQKNNAYLLIYQKQEVQQQMQPQNNPHLEDQVVVKEILLNNRELLKEVTALTQGFGRFLRHQLKRVEDIWSLSVKQEDNQLQDILLKSKIIWKYLKIHNQAKTMGFYQKLKPKDKDVRSLAVDLVQICKKSPQLSQYFLNLIAQQDIIKTMYQCGQKTLRQVYVYIAINVIASWQKYFYTYSYMLPSKQNQTIRKILLQTQNALSQVGKNHLKMDQYFDFIYLLNKTSILSLQYFSRLNLCPKLIHFMMQTQSPHHKVFQFYPLHIPTSKKIQSFNLIIKTIALHTKNSLLIDDQLMGISFGEKNFAWYKKLYAQRYQCYDQISQILVGFCTDNFQLSNLVIEELVLNGINRFSHNDGYILAYLNLLYKLLKLNDNLTPYRINRILGIPIIQINNLFPLLSPTQRLLSYNNNLLTCNDQTIFPFLQLLYCNRKQLTYFSLYGVLILLKLLKQSYKVNKFIMGLPMPCLEYGGYFAWLRQFIAGVGKKDMANVGGQVKSVMAQISELISQIQQGQYLSQYKNINQNMKPQIQRQYINQQIKPSLQRQNTNQHMTFYNKVDQLKINPNFCYLVGQTIRKSQTFTQIFDVFSQKVDMKLFQISIDITLLKSIKINNTAQYIKKIKQFNSIIQPDDDIDSNNIFNKKCLLQQSLKQHYQDEILINSFIKLQLLIQPSKLLSQCYISLSFQTNPTFPYIYLIKPSNLTYQLTIPFPQKCIQQQSLSQDNQSVILWLRQMLRVSLVHFRNQIVQTKFIQSKTQKMVEQVKQQSIYNYMNMNQDNHEDFPTIGQAYGANQHNPDAYQQQFNQKQSLSGQINHQNQTNQSKQETCVECPFCGFISHEFTSRCPNCNQEWGIYA